jgi:hypothetical protein
MINGEFGVLEHSFRRIHLGSSAASVEFDGDPLDAALTSFKTVAYGGTALDSAAARSLLAAVGLTDVVHMPTPPGAPALTAGRRPSPTS